MIIYPFRLYVSWMTTRRISVADTEPDPTDYPVAFEVEVISEQSTPDDPAQVAVTVTNRGEDSLSFHTGFPNVFGGPKSEESIPGLILLPPGNRPPVGVTHIEEQSMGYGLPAVLMSFGLAPGESESITLLVLSRDPADPDGWLPEGTYTFRSNYNVSDANTERPDDEQIDWGFSLTVESSA